MSFGSILLVSLSEVIGDFGFKGVAREGGARNWAFGILGYIGVIYFLIKSLRVGNVTYVNGMWDGVSAVISTIVAYAFFGERLNSPYQYMGLLLIIGGIFCLKSGGIPY
jgi:multidrug transporter EmrE-like cation transporter